MIWSNYTLPYREAFKTVDAVNCSPSFLYPAGSKQFVSLLISVSEKRLRGAFDSADSDVLASPGRQSQSHRPVPGGEAGAAPLGL